MTKLFRLALMSISILFLSIKIGNSTPSYNNNNNDYLYYHYIHEVEKLVSKYNVINVINPNSSRQTLQNTCNNYKTNSIRTIGDICNRIIQTQIFGQNNHPETDTRFSNNFATTGCPKPVMDILEDICNY